MAGKILQVQVDGLIDSLNAKLAASANLSDLNDDASARDNLNLGDSATKDVGVGAGDVAAGDHDHDGSYEPPITKGDLSVVAPLNFDSGNGVEKLLGGDVQIGLNTVTVNKGGTGRSSVTSGKFLKGNGTSAFIERTAAEVKQDISLDQVTNDAQVKKRASSTDNNVPTWDGLNGDALNDGYAVATDLGSEGDLATKLVRADAIKSYVDSNMGANDALTFKGVIDCSTNPNYPASDAGDTYKISVAGKLGGATGVNVEVGDMAICLVDSTPAGTHSAVGPNWNIIQKNEDGIVIGPSSSVDERIAVFDGTSGKLLKDGGVDVADLQNQITENQVIKTANVSANTETTITDVFSPEPSTGCIPRVYVNGILVPKGTSTNTNRWSRDGSSLKLNIPYAITSANSEIVIIYW